MHKARRRFGQNFLHDSGVIAQMIAAIAPQTEESFLEIGPGQGALTKPLLASGVQLTALEIDRDLAARLGEQYRGAANFRLIEGDALTQPLAPLLPNNGKLRIVGNLPYNLSTPLLFHLTAPEPRLHDLHLLLQREVVVRMAAGPGTRDYGRLSVMIQARCVVDPLFDVPPGAFTPAPSVTSRFVRLRPHASAPLPDIDDASLARVVSAAFGQRRKTLRNALSGLLNTDAIIAADIDPAARAEQIDLAGFGRLARQLQSVPAQPAG